MSRDNSPIVPSVPLTAALIWRHEPQTDAPDCQIYHAFTPSWFRQYMNLDYSIRWHTDSRYRRESIAEMRRTVNNVIPELHLGGARGR